MRETWEEVGLEVRPSQLVWANSYRRPRGLVWFFAAHLNKDVADRITFGSEGQEWRLMAPAAYCAHPLTVPHFADQLRNYMAQDQYATNITS